jgi:hypothetical protein
MASYNHPTTGTLIRGYSSHKEHCFYEETTKRQMFLIIEQMSTLLSNPDQEWVERAIEERELLKVQGIK